MFLRSLSTIVFLLTLSHEGVAQSGSRPQGQREQTQTLQSRQSTSRLPTAHRPRSNLDVHSPDFVVAPEYGRYGYLGLGYGYGREWRIEHSR